MAFVAIRSVGVGPGVKIDSKRDVRKVVILFVGGGVGVVCCDSEL